MIQVSVAEFRNNMARVIDLVLRGETVVLQRNGKQVAVLTRSQTQMRGSLYDRPFIPASLDQPGPVRPVRIQNRLRRAPSDELMLERH